MSPKERLANWLLGGEVVALRNKVDNLTSDLRLSHGQYMSCRKALVDRTDLALKRLDALIKISSMKSTDCDALAADMANVAAKAIYLFESPS